MKMLSDMTQSELIQYSSKIEMEFMDFIISKGIESEDLKKAMEFIKMNYNIGVRVGVKNEQFSWLQRFAETRI